MESEPEVSLCARLWIWIEPQFCCSIPRTPRIYKGKKLPAPSSTMLMPLRDLSLRSAISHLLLPKIAQTLPQYADDSAVEGILHVSVVEVVVVEAKVALETALHDQRVLLTHL